MCCVHSIVVVMLLDMKDCLFARKEVIFCCFHDECCRQNSLSVGHSWICALNSLCILHPVMLSVMQGLQYLPLMSGLDVDVLSLSFSSQESPVSDFFDVILVIVTVIPKVVVVHPRSRTTKLFLEWRESSYGMTIKNKRSVQNVGQSHPTKKIYQRE